MFYDGFSSVSSVSWTPRVGNGLDKGWDFYGFGLSEKQVGFGFQGWVVGFKAIGV